MENQNTKIVLCFDALNWLSDTFWNCNADLEYCTHPWEALQNSHRVVGTFVMAARSADFDLVVVMAAGANDPDVRAKYEHRREQEILYEKRGVCLGADMLLAESFQSHGIRVVRPIGADANHVLAALADSVEGAIIVSRNRNFFRYDKALLVSRSFTVSKGKLLLEPPITKYNHARASGNPFTVRPHLALADDKTWCLGHVTKYRPSLRSHGRIELGSSSSSDRRMGNLHAIARPLRAAVYAILGEVSAVERIPEWSDDKERVVWTENQVDADDSFLFVLKDPISVVEWLAKNDTPVAELEPWRAVERHFNICALAAELVAVSSQGAWTMHQCMELFSNDAKIVKRTSRSSFGAETCVQQDHTAQGARTYSVERRTKDEQHQSSTPNALVGSFKDERSSRTRESIFGTGRPREEVLKGRGKQHTHE